MKSQYDAVARTYPDALVVCQVGCFYEWYDAAAAQVMKACGLNPVRPRRGFACQCGVPLRLWASTLSTLLTLGLSLCVVRETEERLGRVQARRMAEYCSRSRPGSNGLLVYLSQNSLSRFEV